MEPWVINCKNRLDAVDKAYGFFRYFHDECSGANVHLIDDGNVCVMEYDFFQDCDEVDVHVVITDRKSVIEQKFLNLDGTERETRIYKFPETDEVIYFPYEPNDED